MTPDDVQILYYPGLISEDPLDITGYVIFSRARFTSQMAAVPGNFEITVRDPDQTMDFTTGHDIRLLLNGTAVFGGYIWQISKTYAFPADNASPSGYRNRLWVLSGTDYNIIFDKRVLRNAAHYTKAIYSPGSSSGSIAIISPITDGELIRDHLRFYVNMSGFDTEDTNTVIDNYTWEKGFPWPEQGTRLREVMKAIATPDRIVGSQPISAWWMDAARKLHFVPEQALAVDWGFSDRPDNVNTFGFREATGAENAMSVVNDALVWGGSEWAAHGDVVFAHVEDTDSVTTHNRWQTSVVGVGSAELGTQALVDARADTIINGPPGTLLGGNMGLTTPERTFNASWFNTRVPEILVPGQVVPITLDVFGDDPIELPLRSLEISWPELSDDGGGWTRFTGSFGMLQSDPAWLWRYAQQLRPGKIVHQVVATAKNDTSRPPYGAMYQGKPATQSVVGDDLIVTLDSPNGSKTLFHIPFMYVGNTLRVFLNGVVQYRGTHYTETSPADGTFTMVDPPGASDVLYVWATVGGTLS